MSRTDLASDCTNHIARLAPELVDELKGGRVLIVGDVMLDHYLFGTVSRISPEAPVPVVQVQSESYVLGGAGNVARNIASLGGVPFLLSYKGNDAAGNQLQELISAEGISGKLIDLADRPTTTKTRVIAHNQQVCRVDNEQTHLIDGQGLELICASLTELVADYDVLILSDYGKGLVQKEFMNRLLDIKSKQNPDIKILIDPKTRNAQFYEGATLLTPNTKEAAECAQCPPLNEVSEILDCGSTLFKRLGLESLLITLGSKGMFLFETSRRAIHIPVAAKKVFDVTGAGDTVISVLALALAQNKSLLESSLLANTAAGIVVGMIGAASVTPEEFKTVISEQGDICLKLYE